MTGQKVSMLDNMRTSRAANRKNKPKSKEKVFKKHMQGKLAFTFSLITLALFALTGILMKITTEKETDYKQIVLSQQKYDSRIIPFKRGAIVDRNGTYLADSVKVYNLIIDPKQILSDQEDFLEPTLNALVEYFQYDRAELEALILEKKDKSYVRYARQLSYEDRNGFIEKMKEYNEANQEKHKSLRIKGVWFEDEYKREYKYNTLACHVLGYASNDGTEGFWGIEQFYNDTLIGTNGREYGYLNDDSNLERVTKTPVNGNTVVSTIDYNIQTVAEKYIDEFAADPGCNRAGVIVMNPNNGEVLAMASNIKFDLNNPSDLSALYSEEQIAAMDEKTKFDAWNTIWRNYCVSDAFEPGSPMKIFTIASAMEEGIINGSESYVCDGGQHVGGYFIKCVKKTGHGILTVTESLMQSCNDVLMQIATQIGYHNFCEYQKKFNFGSKTGIDLPGEANGILYTEDRMGPTDLATNSFGQNYTVTMIQVAAAFSSVINGGNYYEPRVVRQVLNEKGAVVKKVEPNLVRETVSSTTADFLKEALFQTVEKGTGGAAAVEGYQVAGKTGTAEKSPRSEKNYLLSFAGFAPYDNPEVLIYVVIDTPHVEDQPHSTYASVVFQKILKEILPYINVFSSIEPEPAPEQPAPEGETVPETKIYESEEYIETIPGDTNDTGYVESLPADTGESQEE